MVTKIFCTDCDDRIMPNICELHPKSHPSCYRCHLKKEHLNLPPKEEAA